MNDRDWTLLNAYADGELGQPERTMLSARLARDPALAGELARIRELKGRLGALRIPVRQERGDGRGALVTRRVPALAAPLALAAALACLVLLGPSGDGPAGGGVSIISLHAELAALSSPALARVEHGTGAAIVAPPDLSASNLRLFARRRVAAEATADGAPILAYHYRGPNGCALTLMIGAGLALPDTAMARRWPVGERMAVITADGMDPERFRAVAAYAEAAMRKDRAREPLRVAVIDSTASARPCA